MSWAQQHVLALELPPDGEPTDGDLIPDGEPVKDGKAILGCESGTRVGEKATALRNAKSRYTI